MGYHFIRQYPRTIGIYYCKSFYKINRNLIPSTRLIHTLFMSHFHITVIAAKGVYINIITYTCVTGARDCRHKK